MDKEEIKKIDFSKEAEMLKAISHPVRLKIVAGLVESECCVKDIWECLDLPQPVVSQHLSILRNKGIVSTERNGNRTLYNVSNDLVKNIVASCMKEKSQERS